MFRYPFQLAFSAAFGERGYGLPVGGLPETLPTIAADDVRTWHRAALLETRPLVIAVGDVDPARASDELAGIFGSRPAIQAGDLSEPISWLAGRAGESPARVVLRDKAQAALAMAFPGPSRRQRDHAAAQVWGAIASGLGGRLFEALRDRRSLAYTVLASAWQKARGGALVTYIATSPEREEEAREQMLVELERFADEPVSQAELRGAVSYLAGQAEVSRQNAASVAGEILECWISAGSLEEMSDPGAPFRAVDRGRRAAAGGELARSREASGGCRAGYRCHPAACSCCRRPLARPRNPLHHRAGVAAVATARPRIAAR